MPCWRSCMTIPVQSPLAYPPISASNAGTSQASLWFYILLCRRIDQVSWATSGSSNLSTNFWKSLVMIFVRERGRRWLKLVKGDSFWIGVTLASFIDRNIAAMNDWTASWSPEWGAGRNLCTSNRKAHQDQRLCASSLLRATVCTSITGIRVPDGMGIGWGALYAVSVFISLRHWFIN